MELIENDSFEKIFLNSPIGILFYDKNGKLTDANPSALKMRGILSLDKSMEINLFADPNIVSRKENSSDKYSIHKKQLIGNRSVYMLKLKVLKGYYKNNKNLVDRTLQNFELKNK